MSNLILKNKYLKIFLVLFLFLSLLSCDLLKKNEVNKETLISYIELTSNPISLFQLKLLIELFNIDVGGEIEDTLTFGVNIYKVTYKTQYNNEEITASGLCLVPDSEDKSLPILGYQHGTIFHQKNVPSNYTSIFSLKPETGLSLILASCGYVCSVPDYLGYGDSRDIVHPYINKRYTAQACVDMLKAVGEFCTEMEIETNGDLFLTGYSEGGYATVAFLEDLQNQNNLDYNLRGVSAGSGVYRVSETAKSITNNQTIRGPAFYAFVLYSYLKTYGWVRDLSEIFRSPYLGVIRDGLFDGNFTTGDINNRLTGDIQKLLTNKFLNDFRGTGETAYKNAFLENNIGNNFYTDYPLRLFHGDGDLTVPTFNSRQLYDTIKGNGSGANCTLVILPGKNHSSAIEPWIRATISWFGTLK